MDQVCVLLCISMGELSEGFSTGERETGVFGVTMAV